MREIEGYNGNYMIDMSGNVLSVRRGKLLTPYTVKDGVQKVCLRKDGKAKAESVHRLVALTFLSNPDSKPQVDHIDGNKHNNKLENLRWCTNEENQEFRSQQNNDGSSSVSSRIKFGDTVYNSISSLARYLASIRGSKSETIRKELKAVRYGGKFIYGEWCELVT